jgi:lipoate-protein ligase A
MKIYRSKSRDPFFHLAVEEWLLREETGEALFLYQNPSSVVLGRFQNPWLECDLSFMREKNLTLVRRMSGGGTVWHDEGNVNMAWVRPLKGFKKDEMLWKVCDQLKAFNLGVTVNARHDLVVTMPDGSTLKVSGSAYKQTKDRVLHHHTLLLKSDLSVLNRVLQSPHRLQETRSIPSVRSQVMNLGIEPESWMGRWGEAEIVSPSDARFNAGPWKDWQWLMGETPFFRWQFEFQGQVIKLSAHKGLIQELTWERLSLEMNDLGRKLEAQTFYELSQGSIDLSAWQKFLGR